MQNSTDLAVILRDMANDDKRAFDCLYHLYYSKLYFYSKMFLKTTEGIEDILQEVFVKVWMNRRNIKNIGTYNAFLYTVTKNTLLNDMRSRLKSEQFMENHFSNSVSTEFVTQHEIEYRDFNEKVNEFIFQLPEKRRRIYLMSREEGKTNPEIAAELSISVKTVEDHMTHALKFLKKRIPSLGLELWIFFQIIFR
ncbi:RNA polymerase sigma-70 factor [Mangrovibacterium sp.]|uniref:RNA polymerase sigma-70 factor n=1 Tax=Mangrovibacterium sp. TaxID=1961364 RepID=UPI0035679602